MMNMAHVSHAPMPMPVPVINGDSDNDEEDEGAPPPEAHDIRGSDDDEQEDPKDYCKGGYHPITIGSVFNQRYHVIRKLGWGQFVVRTSCDLSAFLFALFSRSFLHGLVVLGSKRVRLRRDESGEKCQTLYGNCAR